MLKDLSESELVLANYMRDLSELAWNASWMDGLEYELWKAVKGELREFGRLMFDQKIIDRLINLSMEANGWIIFDDDQEEVFVSFSDWEFILKTAT